jgi:hypothetical protein
MNPRREFTEADRLGKGAAAASCELVSVFARA